MAILNMPDASFPEHREPRPHTEAFSLKVDVQIPKAFRSSFSESSNTKFGQYSARKALKMSQYQAEQEKILSQTLQTPAFPATAQQPKIQSNAKAANVRKGTQASCSQA
jgi:hypothetical protein